MEHMLYYLISQLGLIDLFPAVFCVLRNGEYRILTYNSVYYNTGSKIRRFYVMSIDDINQMNRAPYGHYASKEDAIKGDESNIVVEVIGVREYQEKYGDPREQ